MRASESLLESPLGRLALSAAAESDGNVFTRDEQRRLAFATLADATHRAGIEAEDCSLRALLELAMHKLRTSAERNRKQPSGQARIFIFSELYLRGSLYRRKFVPRRAK